jgi:hypothetical protein
VMMISHCSFLITARRLDQRDVHNKRLPEGGLAENRHRVAAPDPQRRRLAVNESGMHSAGRSHTGDCLPVEVEDSGIGSVKPRVRSTSLNSR